MSFRKPSFVIVGKSRMNRDVIDGNMKMIDFQEGFKCPKCGMRKDIAEHGACKYCISVYGGGEL